MERLHNGSSEEGWSEESRSEEGRPQGCEEGHQKAQIVQSSQEFKKAGVMPAFLL
jgi:hypothetical protein